MRKKLLFCALLCLIADSGGAYVTDAPHNETNNVQCGDCHTYSLWWTFSPTGPNSPNYGQYTDNVCNSCHTEVGYPYKISHSYTSMGDMHNDLTGEWTSKCVDCHDPHQQAQLDWLIEDENLAADIFLVAGTIDNVELATPASGQTTITYNSTATLPNDNGTWPIAESTDPEVLSWEKKNKFSSRGLIFVHDTTNLINTYSVESVDSIAHTIVLRGTPDTPIEFDDSFGLIYGQYIKKDIATPNSGSRTVKFFDPLLIYTTGAFVDINVPSEGICQVCHTQTDYWLEDGTLVDASRFSSPPSDHNSNAVCSDCHDTSAGFQPTNADHTFFSSTSTTCVNCHSETEDVVIDTHIGVCAHCHTSPPALLASFSAETGKWPSTPHLTGTCYDCHDSNGPGSRDIASDFSNHLKAMNHDSQVLENTNCTTLCHFHAGKDIVTQIHVGSDSANQDPCVKCHNLLVETPGTYLDAQMLSKGTYSGSGQLINNNVSGAADCSNCHVGIAENWKTHSGQGTHANQVYGTGTGLCTRCHKDDVIDVVHSFNCGLCHDGANGGALKSLAATFGPGDCTHCHGADFYRHDPSKFTYYDHELYGTVSPEPAESSSNCMLCHNEGTDMIYDIHTPIELPLPPLPPLNVCKYCHDAAGYLIGSASGFGLQEQNFGNPNTCSTCHSEELTDHPNHPDDAMNLSVLATERCVFCHIGDRIGEVHNNKCLDCHDSLFRQGISELRAGLPDPDVDGNMDGHLDCIECHQALGISFFAADFVNQKNHWKKDNHDGQVASNPGCANCHAGTPIEDVHWSGGLVCGTCHIQTGQLIGSASPLGSGKPPIVDVDCITCHGDFILHSTLNIDLSHSAEVTTTPSCVIAGCHTESNLILDLHGANGCTTCHANNGVLNQPAVPFGGECITCHTTYFDGHQHGTNSHYVSEGNDQSSGQACRDCHLSGSWNEIMTEHNMDHNGGCSTCHSSTRTVNLGAGYSSVANVIFQGNETTPITCLACHSNADTYNSASGTHP